MVFLALFTIMLYSAIIMFPAVFLTWRSLAKWARPLGRLDIISVSCLFLFPQGDTILFYVYKLSTNFSFSLSISHSLRQVRFYLFQRQSWRRAIVSVNRDNKRSPESTQSVSRQSELKSLKIISVCFVLLISKITAELKGEIAIKL